MNSIFVLKITSSIVFIYSFEKKSWIMRDMVLLKYNSVLQKIEERNDKKISSMLRVSFIYNNKCLSLMESGRVKFKSFSYHI